MAANELKLGPTQKAIRNAIRDQLVSIMQGSLVSALKMDDLTSALSSYLYWYSEKYKIEILEPSRFLGYVDEEEEADGSTSWKAGLKYVIQIEVGKNNVVEGEEEKEKDEEEKDEEKKEKEKEKDEVIVGKKDEVVEGEKEWEIVSGTWKEERMDAVSSFVAAV